MSSLKHKSLMLHTKAKMVVPRKSPGATAGFPS